MPIIGCHRWVSIFLCLNLADNEQCREKESAMDLGFPLEKEAGVMGVCRRGEHPPLNLENKHHYEGK